VILEGLKRPFPPGTPVTASPFGAKPPAAGPPGAPAAKSAPETK